MIVFLEAIKKNRTSIDSLSNTTRGDCMFIINTEAAIYRNGKYLIIKRSEKEAHAGGALSLG